MAQHVADGLLGEVKRAHSDSHMEGPSESGMPSDSAFAVPKLPGLAAVEELRVPMCARALPSMFAGSSWATASLQLVSRRPPPPPPPSLTNFFFFFCQIRM